CRPTHNAPALGRAQMIVVCSVDRLLIRLSSLRVEYTPDLLTRRRAAGHTGARYFRLQLVGARFSDGSLHQSGTRRKIQPQPIEPLCHAMLCAMRLRRTTRFDHREKEVPLTCPLFKN